MTDGMYIDEASLRNLRVNIRYFEGYVLGKAKDGLRAFGMRIVARAKVNLKKNGQIAFGHLRDSGRTVAQPDGTVDAGFYMGYAYWVEEGRNPGGMPPVDDIYAWIVKKKIQPDGEGDLDERRWAMAWNIARYIKAHGTKDRAKPFLKPAYEEYRIKIGQFMQAKIDEAAEQFKKK